MDGAANLANALVTRDDISQIMARAGLLGAPPAFNLTHYQRALVHRSYVAGGAGNLGAGNLGAGNLGAEASTASAGARAPPPLQPRSNERDGHLGDGLLACIVGRYLADRLPDDSAAALTRTRIKLVSRERLAELAQRLGLDRLVLLSARVEAGGGGRALPSILSDAFKAFVGAVYLDQREHATRLVAERAQAPLPAKRSRYGAASEALLSLVTPDAFAYARAARFVVAAVERFVDFAEMLATETNFKDLLTKHFQRHFQTEPTYQDERAEGPRHLRTFTLSVHHVNGEHLGTGSGRTKRAAQQAAAQAALQRLGVPARYAPERV